MTERELKIVEALRLFTFQTIMGGVLVRTGGETYTVQSSDWHCCIIASRLALEVLRENYIKARALKVHTQVSNRAARDWIGSGCQDPMPERAFVIAAGSGDGEHRTEGLLNGHCVLIVEDQLLLDPSATQFSMVECGYLAEPLTIDLSGDIGQTWLRDPGNPEHSISVEDEDGVMIAYRQSPNLDGLYDSGDWNNSGPEVAALLDSLRARVRTFVDS